MNAFADVDIFDTITAECPVRDCNAKLTPIELLTHLLMNHRPEDSMLEIGADWHTVYDMDLATLTAGRNHVVAVIAYAGANNARRSRAIGPELQLVNHVPLLLMLYVSPPATNLEQVYIVYLVSPVASKSVNAHVSLLHGSNGKEVRGLRCVRDFLNAPLQDCEELLHGNIDYLIYTATDIWEHCTAGDRCQLSFKVVLHGEPNLFESQFDYQEQAFYQNFE